MKESTRNRGKEAPYEAPKSAALEDIRLFCGNEGVEAAQRHAETLRAQIAKNIRETPDAYGAGADAESRRIAEEKLAAEWSERYYEDVRGKLRRQEGYVRIRGVWVHRSWITYCVFAIGAILTLLFTVSAIFSPAPGALLKGIVGTVVTVAIGIAILAKVRKS